MASFGAPLLAEWMLDPTVTYLNHGTVGATPRRVLAAQQATRDQIERHPAQFLLRDLADPEGRRGEPSLMRLAAARVAEFVGADVDGVGFVDNATTGINAVLRSFPFAPGDEILLTTLGYGSVAHVAAYVAGRTGASVRVALLPAPGAPTDSFIEAVRASLGPATRMLVIDHVTAETALVLPVADIVRACHQAGVLVLVDGAHAPGAIPLDVRAIEADWYVGNLHKWAFAPRSAGFVWCAPHHRAHLHPVVVSWGYGHGLGAEFDLPGTRDPTPFLCAPDGIELLREWGVMAVQQHNHQLAWTAGQQLSDWWGTPFTTPEEMVGTMVNVRLPDHLGGTAEDAEWVRSRLADAHRIEVPVFAHPGGLTLRVSAQVYNDLYDVEHLANAVSGLTRSSGR